MSSFARPPTTAAARKPAAAVAAAGSQAYSSHHLHSSSAPAYTTGPGLNFDGTPPAAREEDHLEQQADGIARRAIAAPADEGGLRTHLGSMLGRDFSQVRLHRSAPEAAADGSHAFTQGSDIFLAPGRYRPDLPVGRALIAHEFTHVAQQGAAPRLPYAAGHFQAALGEGTRRGEYLASSALAEKSNPLADPQPGLSPAPLGMRQRCSGGCANCSGEHDQKDAGPDAADAGTDAQAAAPVAEPKPTHAVGPSAKEAGHKIIRLAWTVDDGPTPHTGKMDETLGVRQATWFIMSNQLGKGQVRKDRLDTLLNRQQLGDEVAIHSMYPDDGHVAWFPIGLKGVKKGESTKTAMTYLVTFTNELRDHGLKVRFVRMPGGELSEVRKYVSAKGGKDPEATARKLLAGEPAKPPAPPEVAADVALVMKTIKDLHLHLWDGTDRPAELNSDSWEAESSGVPERDDNVLGRFKGMVNEYAGGKRKKPGSLLILAHDTTPADVAMAQTNIAAMENYAKSNGVRVEYYRMADLYQIVRGTPP